MQIRVKFVDLFKPFSQYRAEMFVNPTMPMIAVAALKRVAWHFIVPRRDF